MEPPVSIALGPGESLLRCKEFLRFCNFYLSFSDLRVRAGSYSKVEMRRDSALWHITTLMAIFMILSSNMSLMKLRLPSITIAKASHEYRMFVGKSNIYEFFQVSKNVGWKSLGSTRGNRKRMILIVAIGWFSQWSGSGLVSYYLNKVFNSIGITNTTIQLMITGYVQVSPSPIAISEPVYPVFWQSGTFFGPWLLRSQSSV